MSATSSVGSQYNSIVNSAASTDTVSGGPNQTLTQNDFLQLLVAQMENQDPLQPQSDTEMASQMAQFTSLTQSTAMSSSLSMMQANSLIGSTVTLQIPNSKSTTSGVVQSVELGSESSDGTPQVVVGGTSYDLSSVLSVAPTSSTSNTSNAAAQTPTTSN
jgi:flagellar basal-body rod modification protein FlgD